jgi:hypothetical protein
MRDCFHDDSVVRISWINASGPEFVRRSKEMAERNVKASHRLGPIFVTLARDRAIAQLNAMVDIPFTLKGTDVIVTSGAFRVSIASTCATRLLLFFGTDHRGRSGDRESLSPDLSSIVLLSRVQRISSQQ